MFVVREGDVVVMHIENHSGEVHPMHLHGHHEVVLARNGVAASRKPLVGRLAQRAARRERTTSPSWPIIRASGWTTATTSNTPPRE